MTLQKLKDALGQKPFAPFSIRTADGRSYPVPHPECVAIPPRAERTFIVFAPDSERHAVVDLLLVAALDFDDPAATDEGASDAA